ncbi:MoaD/ThiS family protein [Desulforamulus ferrireducens]|uniref:Molybdopterin synthase sulfur carrier subunit n=1 Tax=Desulforamulus ferrireducens TaxID=1833852 RepID=A0A1S6IY29_9FIRM|nr:MoaD/ThiS family protein [Desulforamulus ferrireducens]AQS59683.1 molybdopterin synthase sulfur carrier subunit [Desulforamulus ferrireducens]
MLIELRVYTGLERYTGTRYGELIKLELAEGVTIRDILAQYKIPEQEVFSSLVNGLHKSLDTVLQDGDRVALFPPVGGG